MRDKEEKNITEIMGLSDDVIKNYLRSNPNKAKKLALTLISLDKERTQRREFHKSVSSLTQRRSPAYMRMFGLYRAYAEAIKGNPFAIILVVIFLLIIIITAIIRSLYYG